MHRCISPGGGHAFGKVPRRRDPRVTSALIGASSPEQLTESVAALSNLRFTTEELVQIDKDAAEGGVNLWARSSEAG